MLLTPFEGLRVRKVKKTSLDSNYPGRLRAQVCTLVLFTLHGGFVLEPGDTGTEDTSTGTGLGGTVAGSVRRGPRTRPKSPSTKKNTSCKSQSDSISRRPEMTNYSPS